MWKITEAFSSSSGMIYWTHWSSSDKGSQAPCVVFLSLVFFFSLDCWSSSSTCFSKWRRKCFTEGRASAAKSRTIPPPSLVAVWGIQSKVCPVTCSLRNRQRARVSKDQSHQRRVACAWAKLWHLSESFHHRKIVSCRSGEWLAWLYIDTLMQWIPRTVQ